MSTRTACPACRAAVRAEATWCGQCFAELRAPQPQPEVRDRHAAAPVAPDAGRGRDGQPAGQEPDDRAAPGRVPDGRVALLPCPACGTPAGRAFPGCGREFGDALAARLRTGERPLVALPGLGDLLALPRGRRAALAGAVAAALCALMALLVLLTG